MGKVVTADAQRFMVDCLRAVGAACKPAMQQAELLIEADKIGHPTHGLNRLALYVNDIQTKKCLPNNEPKILKENKATAWVDANNVLGATAGHFGMDLAIDKACKAGVGWVSLKGSNHNGMGGFWAKKAADKGMIGIAFTNTFPLLAPTRSKKVALGTNPISVAASGTNNEMFYIDISTSAVSFGKIEMQLRKGEPIGSGWAQDAEGKETLDAKVAHKVRSLLPLGGFEETSGFKGYGLAAMVELFCGMTSGAHYGHHIPTWGMDKGSTHADLGQCYVAVNIDNFAPGFEERVTDCLTHWRKLDPTDPCVPVISPGDMERKILEECEKCGTVTYIKHQIDTYAALAKKLNVKPMTVT